jgi:hypothetical protein
MALDFEPPREISVDVQEDKRADRTSGEKWTPKTCWNY